MLVQIDQVRQLQIIKRHVAVVYTYRIKVESSMRIRILNHKT